jgi:hypothetical protein
MRLLGRTRSGNGSSPLSMTWRACPGPQPQGTRRAGRIGALNSLGECRASPRCALAGGTSRPPVGPLLRGLPRGADSTLGDALQPLAEDDHDERLAADYAGTGLTTGPHPMAYHREALRRQGILSADELNEGLASNRQSASPVASSPASAPAPPRGSSFSPSKTKPASPTSSSRPMSSRAEPHRRHAHPISS